MTSEDIERLAMRLVSEHGSAAPPVNVDEVANRLDLDFVLADFDSLDGSYIADEHGRAHAMINRHKPRLRQRFTKAHELAHHVLDNPTIVKVAGFEHLRLPSGFRRGHEREWAHQRFAGAVLMPRSWVAAFMREQGWRLERPPLVARVARVFDVSMSAAEVRLRELGHVPDRRER